MSQIHDILLHRVPVTWRTTWVFAEVRLADGSVGWGEPSDAHIAEIVARRWPQLTSRYRGLQLEDAVVELQHDVEAAGIAMGSSSALPADATLLGGIEQAFCDLAAQHAGVPLSTWLGGDGTRSEIDLYANINRGVRERTPAEFARVARAAVDDGFRAIKCAPFDFLVGDRRADTGMRLIEAIREEIGDGVDLMLDAHNYLTLEELDAVADRIMALGLRWVEDVAYVNDPAMVARAREIVDVPQAGGEFVTRDDQIEAALSTGAIDVFMPDVKHAGGDRAALRLGQIAVRAGVEVSLHNPTGPIGMAHSIAASMALPGTRILECAYGEAPWRLDLITGGQTESSGRGLASSLIGLGVGVDRAELARRVDGSTEVGWSHPGSLTVLS